MYLTYINETTRFDKYRSLMYFCHELSRFVCDIRIYCSSSNNTAIKLTWIHMYQNNNNKTTTNEKVSYKQSIKFSLIFFFKYMYFCQNILLRGSLCFNKLKWMFIKRNWFLKTMQLDLYTKLLKRRYSSINLYIYIIRSRFECFNTDINQ